MYVCACISITYICFKILHSPFFFNNYYLTTSGFFYITINPSELSSIGSTQLLFPSRTDDGSVGETSYTVIVYNNKDARARKP